MDDNMMININLKRSGDEQVTFIDVNKTRKIYGEIYN